VKSFRLQIMINVASSRSPREPEPGSERGVRVHNVVDWLRRERLGDSVGENRGRMMTSVRVDL